MTDPQHPPAFSGPHYAPSAEVRLALEILDAELAATDPAQGYSVTVLVAASAACRARVWQALRPMVLEGLLEARTGPAALSEALAGPVELVLREATLGAQATPVHPPD